MNMGFGRVRTLVLAAACLGAGCLAAGSAAHAADPAMGTAEYGDVSITVGGGTVMLTLPDVGSMMTRTSNVATQPVLENYNFSNDLGRETGWGLNGSISVPAHGGIYTLGGFWARVDDRETINCVATAAPNTGCVFSPLADTTAATQSAGTGFGWMNVNAARDVDYWGVSLERKWRHGEAVPREGGDGQRYLAAGLDLRGIDQDITANMTTNIAGTSAVYRENLDTTYYGAYLAWGGYYSLPFLRSAMSGFGLRSSFMLRGGAYYADTDYSGRITAPAAVGPGNPSGALALSNSEFAFIGGLVLETTKKVGRRATLSMKSEYEFISYVPDMTYNTFDSPFTTAAGHQRGTRIGSSSAFSVRSTLRLTVPLGP